MAKKDGFHPIKFIITGVFWSALYFGIIMPAVGWLFDFDFLSLADWQQKYQAFVNYKWKVNTLYDTLLLFTMLLWLPLWLVGWRYFYKVNWKKFKPAPRKKTIVKKTFELRENKQIYHMPRKMPSVVQATRYVAPKLPNQTEEVVSGAKSHTNLVQMIRSIATLAKKYKVEIFQHILLEGNRVPMAISTDARAVLIEIVNKKNVNWSVEFTDDVTQGSWYSEGGVMDKLAQDLVRASASLAKSEPNSEVLSAIVVTDGRVLNTKQAVEYFKSKGIFLIGFNNAEPKAELPDLASFLSAYFDLKEGETDPAPHPVEKVPLRAKQSEQPAAAETPVEENSNETAEETEIEETDEDLLIEDEETDEDLLVESEEVENEKTDEDLLVKSEDVKVDETLAEGTTPSSVPEPTPSVSKAETAPVRKIRAPMPAQIPNKNTPTE